MKRKIGIGIGIILIILAGWITNYVDSGRVTTGHEPKYCIKQISKDGSKITYWGLGYKVIRYVSISPNEPYKNNIGVKMGSWFMSYDFPNQKDVRIEYNGKVVPIVNHDDIDKIYHIVIDSKYDLEICDGINTHKIIIDKEEYYLKESCQEIQKGDKQAEITKEDLDMIIKIIKDNE